MALRHDLVPAARAVQRRPAVLAVGAAIAVAQAVLGAAAGAAAAVAEPVVGPLGGTLVGPLLALGAVVVAVPLYAGVYAPVLETPAGPCATIARAGRAVRRSYGPLLGAVAVAAAVAAAAGLLAVTLWLVASTGFRYARYALADPRPPLFDASLLLGTTALAGGTLLGGLAVRFSDAFVLFEDAHPRRAWRASLRFARRRPLSLLGYGAVVALLQGGPGLAGGLAADVASGRAGSPGQAGALVGLATTVVVGSVGLTLALALTAVYFERTVAPTVGDAPRATRPLGARSARAAVAATVLFAAVGGAAAVRAADVRPPDDRLPALSADGATVLPGGGRAPLSDDPLAAYEAAAVNTVGSNHRVVLRSRNESDPDSTMRITQRSGVDYRDRQAYVYFVDEGGRQFGGYFGEGTLATRNSPGRWSGAVVRRRGNWTVIPAPGYGLAQPRNTAGSNLPDVDGNWTVAARNDSTLVLRLDRPSAIPLAFGADLAGMGPDQSPDSFAAVVVDRDRRVVRRVVLRVHSRETGRNFRHVVRYEDVGTADLRRPDAIGSRGVLEWLWDVLYY